MRCSGSNSIAGVHCEGECTDGKVRLRGGFYGRVEVCANGTWTTICDEYWDDNDASVICRQLGYSPYGAQVAYGLSVPIDYPTRIYRVNCTGREAELFNCPIHLTVQEVSNLQCRDASVVCQVESFVRPGNCETGEVKLSNGNKGRVDVCINNMWGSICTKEWDTIDGNVICHQLGYQRFGSKPTIWRNLGLKKYPIILASLNCTGSEVTLADCSRNAYSLLDPECFSNDIAELECEELCTNGDVRIVGSSDSSYGRVEVCINQTWGTICDSTWNDAAASVICKHQGFSPFGAIAAKNGFSVPFQPVHIDSVNCFGNESSIFECSIVYGGENSVCDSLADSGVICQTNGVVVTDCLHGELRLVDGKTPTEGRLEICINGVWGTVCDNSWDKVDANVACNQLGYYPSGAKPRYGSFYGKGSGPIFLANMYCTGSEFNLLDCNRNMYGVQDCKHYEDAGVKCLGSFPVYSSHSVGSLLGGDVLIITGPVFKQDDDIKCIFGQTETQGAYISEEECVCVVPEATTDGLVSLEIRILRGSATLSGVTKFRYTLPMEIESAKMGIRIDSEDYLLGAGERVNVSWDLSTLTSGLLTSAESSFVRINISMIFYDTETDKWEERITLASNVAAGDGVAEVIIPEVDETSIKLSQIKVSLSTINENEIQKIFMLLKKIAKKLLRFVFKNVIKDVAASVAQRLACEAWYHYGSSSVDNRRLPPCPCTKSQADKDDRYNEEHNIWRQVTFNKKKARTCYSQSNIGSNSPSQRCCYNRDGDIMTGTDGGNPYSVYPNNWESFKSHFVNDVVPHYLCCDGKYFSGCEDRYNDRRPVDNCEEYPERPPPARTFGDPHMVSLDGFQYTFNGHGEFTLLQSLDNLLNIQVRMTELHSNRNDSNQTLSGSGTVMTAIVAKDRDSDTVQFEIFNGTMVALVNGDEVDFTDLPTQQFTNLTVTDKGNQTYTASLTNSVIITITQSNNIIGDLTVTLSDGYYNYTAGLLGLYNGIPDDDLLPKNGNSSLSINSTTEEIHYQFGMTWIIDNPDDSLFTYDVLGSWNTFFKPEYKPIFEVSFNDSTLEEKALEICGDNKLCLFDVAATGDLSIGDLTKEVEKEQETLSELLKPTICDPTCVHGACIGNNTCACSEGYEGNNCNNTVYESCVDDFCLNGATCIIAAKQYHCICLSSFTGPDCGTPITTTSPSLTSLTIPSTNEVSPFDTVILIGSAVGVVVVLLFILIVIVAIVTCIAIYSRRKIKLNTQHLNKVPDYDETMKNQETQF
jgi:deleted-in-malignant-brain-tumors protein 1